MRNKTRPSIMAIIHGHRRHYHQPRLSSTAINLGHQSRPSIPAINLGYQSWLSSTAIDVTAAATRNTLQFATQLQTR